MQFSYTRLRTTTFLMLLFIIVATCFSQTYWRRYYKGLNRVETIVPTTDGNFLLGGENWHDGLEYYQGWLMKIEPDGDSIWTRTFPDDTVGAVFPMTDGGCITGGVTLISTHGLHENWVARLDPAGNTLWRKVYSGEQAGARLNTGVAAGRDGYLMAGRHSSEREVGRSEGWLIRIDSTGTIEWDRRYRFDTASASLNEVYQYKNDTVFATGEFNPDSSGRLLMLCKIGPDGELVWKQTFGKDGGWHFFDTLLVADDDNVIVTGHANSYGHQNGYHDIFIAKVSQQGEILWLKTYGSPDNENVMKTVRAGNGNLLLCGLVENYDTGRKSDGWAIMVDPNGDTLWSKLYGDTLSNSLYSAWQTNDGHFMLQGSTFLKGFGSMPWFIKIDPEGNILWTKEFKEYWESFLTARYHFPNGDFLFGSYGSSFSRDSQYVLLIYFVADRYAFYGSPFSFKIPVDDADSLRVNYLPLDVPEGMAVSPGGTISWVPHTDSVYREKVAYQVIYDSITFDTLTFNLFVNTPDKGASVRDFSERKTVANSPFRVLHNAALNRITFFLQPSVTTVSFYDITGRLIDRITPLIPAAGKNLTWPDRRTGGGSAASGHYFAVFTTGKDEAIQSFMLLR